MKRTKKYSGLTLTEMVVVMAIIALLTAIGLPAVRALLKSFEFSSGSRDMLSAALSGARAIAAKEHRYAGIRFQQDKDGCQYMIYIVHDPEKTGLSSGFRAVEGIEPIKFSGDVRAADFMVRVNHGSGSGDAEDLHETLLRAANLDDTSSQNLGADGKNVYITDMSSFSIVFAPTGKLIVHEVRLRNKDGIYRPDNTNPARTSMDDIFNSPENIENLGIGKFVQDDYAHLGLGAESSRNRIIIYDGIQFDKLDAQGRLDYLNSLEPIYINPYTGTLISNRL
ncbi:MAG: prepilin-type N-terminal cleavage/methylation domain-containing protein [Sedimentisphaerales bacterium]|nr:prepilin-type N-terminal cleavage/methylation domain-containing protein [Sedimentisphaerales bacterium]